MVEEQKGRISYYGEGCQEVFGYIWHLHPSREDYIKVGPCTVQEKTFTERRIIFKNDVSE